MKKARVAVIDYGMGNLRSVSKALEISGADAFVTDNKDEILSADGVVLPGVGSFAPAVSALKKGGLFAGVREFVGSGRPFLGICLGFQLIFDYSTEVGKRKGFGFVKGAVKRFRFGRKPSCRGLNIPHMGWNTVKVMRSKQSAMMFAGVPDNSHFYFVHSYYPELRTKTAASGLTDYGIKFCSAVAKDNIWACQFHPEKSGKNGLRILKNFVKKVNEGAA